MMLNSALRGERGGRIHRNDDYDYDYDYVRE